VIDAAQSAATSPPYALKQIAEQPLPKFKYQASAHAGDDQMVKD